MRLSRRRALLALTGAALALGLAGVWGAPRWAGAQIRARLAARGITADWQAIGWAAPGTLRLTDLTLRRGAWTAQAARVEAHVPLRALWGRRQPDRVDLWQVEVMGALGAVEPPTEGAALRPAPGGSLRARLAGLRVTVHGAQATVRRGEAVVMTGRATRADWADGEARLQDAQAQVRWPGVPPLTLPPQAVTARVDPPEIAAERVQVGGAAPVEVQGARLTRTPAGWAAAGRALGSEGTIHVAGPPRQPDVVEVEGTLELAAVAAWMAARGVRLPATLRGKLTGALTIIDPLGDGPVAQLTARGDGVQVSHPGVGPTPVDVSAAVDLIGHRDPTTGGWQVAGHAQRGALRLDGWAAGDALARDATLVAEAQGRAVPCQAAYAAIPAGLTGDIESARLTGTFAPWLRLTLPLHWPRRLTLRARGLEGACRITALRTRTPTAAKTAGGDPRDVDWLLHGFTRAVPEATRPVTVGPGHPSFVPLGSLPAYVPAVMYLSEDPGFYGHGALSVHLVQRALKLNLAGGRFVYGGSTLPQQLVKNVFLARTKTLARKVEELILAARVVDAVPKARLLALYLNTIEFAPNVYGIERAARHYFGVGARHLTPKQAVFLATAKPSPRYADQRRRLGSTPDTAHARRYMQRLFARLVAVGALTEAQVAAARPFRILWPAAHDGARGEGEGE